MKSHILYLKMETADLKIKVFHHYGECRLSVEIDSTFAKLTNSDCFLSTSQSQWDKRTQYMCFNNYSDITLKADQIKDCSSLHGIQIKYLKKYMACQNCFTVIITTPLADILHHSCHRFFKLYQKVYTIFSPLYHS